MSAQALQVSSNYRELEKKYGALTSIMSSQNQFIARLEKQCQCRDAAHSSLVGNQLACCKFILGFYATSENAGLSLYCTGDDCGTKKPIQRASQ